MKLTDKQKPLDPKLDERYQIKGVLGEGGMGIVYHAHDNILAIDVAIKMLRSDMKGMASVRLQREAIAAGKLQNPNIARIFDFNQTQDGSPYMVMEFVSGKSLAEIISETGPMPFAAAIHIFMQICRGLEHAHTNSIVHRDLKPSNVMLVEREYGTFLVKILDFGIAKIITDQKLTSDGSLLGSPLYMSPEQCDAAPVDLKSDLYSLGCLMFETLSGKPPLKGNSAIETMSLHKNSAPPLLSEVTSNYIPNELVNLIDKCLRKHPEARPESAHSIEMELQNILNPVKPEPTTDPIYKKIYRPESEVEKKISKFSKSTALTIGGVLTLGAIIALGLSFQHFEKKSKAETQAASVSSVPKIETSEKDLDDNYNKYDNFEFGQAEGLPVLLTKKEATDLDLAKIVEDKYTILKMRKGKIKGTGLSYLSKMNLVWLEIRHQQFECENLKYLKSIKTLKKLILSEPQLTDTGLKNIAQAKSLEQLTITTGSITDKGVDYLISMPNLKKLELSNCPKLTPELGKKVAKIKTLTYFTMPIMQSVASIQAIAKSNIKDLNLSGIHLGANDLESLSAVKDLNSLGIANITIDGNNYDGLYKLTNLKKLDLSTQLQFSSELLSTLAKLNVPEIDFSHSNLRKTEIDSLLKNPHLKRLCCTECKFIQNSELANFQDSYQKTWKRQIEVVNFGFDQDDINEAKNNSIIMDD